MVHFTRVMDSFGQPLLSNEIPPPNLDSQSKVGSMVDLNGEAAVQVQIDDKGTLWVNVSGICRLRSQGHLVLEVDDQRIDSPRCLVNPDLLDEDVLSSVMVAMGWSQDQPMQKYMDKIATMSVYEVMDRYLKWNGIIGWTPRILGALKSCLSSSTMVYSGETSNSHTKEQSSTTKKAT